MQLRNKYYPYPVIVEGGDYYENSKFSSSVNQEMVGYDAKITITVELNDTLLLQKIEQGEVVFAHHIECPQTCYRRVIKTKEKVKDILLKDKDVNGIVQICSFVIAEKDIDKYTNESFAADYRGWKFNIEKGCILAIGNQYNVRINKIREKMPDCTIRTSIIVGFPGETEEQFNDLYEFVKKVHFDRMGAFTYSQEEDTPAADFPYDTSTGNIA